MNRCPQCGEQIQATRIARDFYSLQPDGTWKNADIGNEPEVRYKCANDCELDPKRHRFPVLEDREAVQSVIVG